MTARGSSCRNAANHPQISTTECVAAFAVAPAAGNGPVVEIDVEAGGLGGPGGSWHVWAPDDTSILSIPLYLTGLPVSSPLLWDPLTGASQPAPWAGRGDFSWQRLAP